MVFFLIPMFNVAIYGLVVAIHEAKALLHCRQALTVCVEVFANFMMVFYLCQPYFVVQLSLYLLF